jgi:hypothetical protein
MIRSLCLGLVLLCLSCGKKHVETGHEIIAKSIEIHGGWQAYQQLDTIAYSKSTRLFKEDGTLEKSSKEAQVFTFLPEYTAFLLSDTGYVTYKKDSLVASVHSRVVTTAVEKEQAMNRINAAQFVFLQPFKLNEAGVESQYLRQTQLNGTLEVSEVKVTFTNTTNTDQWWFYFDSDYRLVANKVKHNDRYSLIENLKFQEYKGLLFNEHRKSYFVDSLGNKKYLRAEYFYRMNRD